MKILILTDSRGYGLQGHIRQEAHSSDDTYTVVSRGGATLEYLQAIAEKKVEEEGYELVVIAAGICGFTVRDKVTKTISYPVSRLKENIEALNNIRGKLEPNLLIATVPFANLGKYNKTHQNNSSGKTAETERQQRQLEEDLKAFNTEIIDGCLRAGTEAIKLHEHLIENKIVKKGRGGKKRQKIQKITYNELYDGVHPSEKLKIKHFTYLLKVTKEYLSYRGQNRDNFKIIVTEVEEPEGAKNTTSQSEAELSQDTDTQEEDKGSWDFKRQGYQKPGKKSQSGLGTSN